MASCPSSLKSAGQIFSTEDEEVEMPEDYYIYTALMIGIVIVTPFLYRQLWLLTWAVARHYRRPKHLRGGPPGCLPVGKLGHRNLSKEHGSSAPVDGHATEKTASKVEALFVYPIKSCYPVELESSTITQTSFQYDRQFCFATWHDPTTKTAETTSSKPKQGSSAYWDARPHWEFATQRQNPSLTHLKVEIWTPSEEAPEYDKESEVVKSGGCLIISFPFTPPINSLQNLWAILHAKLTTFDFSAKPIWKFQIPLDPTEEQIEECGYDKGTVRIWRDEPSGVNMTSEIPEQILGYLQMLLFEDIKKNSPHKASRMKSPPELRLYRLDKTKDRNLYKCAPTEEQLGYQATIAYQDSYPIHLQNIASIAEAEKQITPGKAFEPDSRRYRANIYISGPPPYDEDDWTYITIANHGFHVSCRTTRCKLPTNNPDTGALGSDVQPYNYLMKNRAIDEGAPQSGCLGMMLVPSKEAVAAMIKVGDEVEVVRRGKHFFVADAEAEAQRPVF